MSDRFWPPPVPESESDALGELDASIDPTRWSFTEMSRRRLFAVERASCLDVDGATPDVDRAQSQAAETWGEARIRAQLSVDDVEPEEGAEDE